MKNEVAPITDDTFKNWQDEHRECKKNTDDAVCKDRPCFCIEMFNSCVIATSQVLVKAVKGHNETIETGRETANRKSWFSPNSETRISTAARSFGYTFQCQQELQNMFVDGYVSSKCR